MPACAFCKQKTDTLVDAVVETREGTPAGAQTVPEFDIARRAHQLTHVVIPAHNEGVPLARRVPPLMNSLSFLRSFHFWMFTAVLLTALSAILTSPRLFGFTRSGPLNDISQGSGHLCSAPFPDELRRPPKRRILPPDKPVLTENGRPLSRPNAGSKAIEREGEGRFRIAGNTVKFSSSDQTSPTRNARSYVITVSAFRVPEWLLLALWSTATAAWLVAVVGFRSHCLTAFTAGFAWLGEARETATEVLIKRPRLATFAHLLVILMFAWLIFYKSRGEFPIQGDCVVAIESAYSMEVCRTTALITSLRERAFLPTTQNILYHWFGDSYAKVQVLFMVLLVSSAILWYAVLRQLFAGVAALLGALFFLAYAGKYETLTWFAAGMYVVVMLLCILIFGVTRLQIKPWIQVLLICTFLWLSLIWYEVLIMILPVFPILYLGRCIAEKRRPYAKDWALAFLPAIPVLFHILVLGTAKRPIWYRSARDIDYQIPLYDKVALGFANALKRAFGQEHFDQLVHGVHSFFQHVAPANPGVFGLFIGAVLGLIGVIIFGQPRASAQKLPGHHLYGIAGLYMALFAGTITFILGRFVPSRMTFLPSFGLSLFLAYLAHQALAGSLRQPALRWLIVGAVASLCIGESITFSSIVKQAEAARAFDQAITDQIHEIQPNIPKGSEVFVTMTAPAKLQNGFWRDVSSSYNNGTAYAPLWYKYGSGVNEIKFSNATRFPNDPPDSGFYTLIERYASIDRHRFFPFVIDEDLSVMGISSIVIADRNRGVVEELKFPSMDNAKSDRLTSVQVAQSQRAIDLLQ